MNLTILNKEVQKYINTHLNDDLSKLILKGSPFNEISAQDLGQQIKSKKKSQNKLPSWFNNSNIYYPKSIHIEQSSSELTAIYKSNLVKGKKLIDITGGFGVDTYYFSKKISDVIHCEHNAELSQICSHNFDHLGVENIECRPVDGISQIEKSTKDSFDFVYSDPSRRNDGKGKVFMLQDCLPNIPENLYLLLSKSRNLLIKTAPLLDISMGIEELKFVKEVHVVAVKNEVKELLFLIEKDWAKTITIHTVNIEKETTQNFNFDYKAATEIDYKLPLSYIYEPNHAILKSGGFGALATQLKISKLHSNSHLYTASELIDFPGRRFKLLNSSPYKKKDLLRLIPKKKANITIRNFPETVAKIRKKTGLKDGGDEYLFFTTDKNNRFCVLHCSKV